MFMKSAKLIIDFLLNWFQLNNSCYEVYNYEDKRFSPKQ